LNFAGPLLARHFLYPLPVAHDHHGLALGNLGKLFGGHGLGASGPLGRSVPISKRLAKELKSYLDSLHPNALKPEAPLFVSQKGGRFTPHGIVMLLQRLYRDAGIHDASSHSGRRSFATGLAEKGVSVFVLKELLGHSSIQTTSGYVHAGEHMQRNAVELL
jgi:integrase/recombinase XerD|tara:strand:- start:500 stop:982 length:483 start_codon:yes stop_codon:yes gene_type:complete